MSVYCLPLSRTLRPAKEEAPGFRSTLMSREVPWAACPREVSPAGMSVFVRVSSCPVRRDSRAVTGWAVRRSLPPTRVSPISRTVDMAVRQVVVGRSRT